MLLDLSGLTREERVTVQASISNKRDALIIQHPRIHFRESQRRTKGNGKDGFKRGDSSNTLWFRGQGKGKHTGSGKSRASAYYANFTSVEDYDYDDDINDLADGYQAHNDPVDPGSDDGEEALDDDDDDDDDEENDAFSSCVSLDDVAVIEAAELDAIALLADTHKLTFPSERRKEKARADILFARHTCHWRIVDDD